MNGWPVHETWCRSAAMDFPSNILHYLSSVLMSFLHGITAPQLRISTCSIGHSELALVPTLELRFS